MLGSMAFSWYVASFDSYNRTYGSLGAGVGFMSWMWLSIVIVLLGAEMNSEMERQTARDTTEGQPKPLGSREAYAADTRAGEACSAASHRHQSRSQPTRRCFGAWRRTWTST